MEVPHALHAWRTEVAGYESPHARVDGRLEDRLLLEGRLCVDRAQEDVDALQMLGELRGRIRGAVSDADLDAACTQGRHDRLGCGGRAREDDNVLQWVSVSAMPMSR